MFWKGYALIQYLNVLDRLDSTRLPWITVATAADSVTAASTAAVLQREQAQGRKFLPGEERLRDLEVLRRPDPVLSELEISSTSGEREELDCTNREIDEDVMEQESPWIRWKKENLPPECL